MGVVRVKDDVLFTLIAPGGFRILSAIDTEAKFLPYDLVITSACDGLHSGPDDPHHRGEAYDVRSHDLPDKLSVLTAINNNLGMDRFYGFLESPDTDNEHFHFQVKKGTTFP
jgi:hypothetical protein